MVALGRKSYRKRLWRNKRHVCYYCGRILLKHEITADHVIPLAVGGYDSLKNVVPCCRTCNGLKGKMSWQDFLNTPRFKDPNSGLNQNRREHPKHYNMSKAHG